MIERLMLRLEVHSWWKWGLLAVWAITMVGLPLTSFPLLTGLTGAMVAPFSAIPLAILVVAWFIPFFLRRGQLPKEVVPLVLFVLLAFGLAGYSMFLNVDIFKDKTVLDQTIRAFIPLIIGVAFYFVTTSWHKTTLDLRRTLQFITIGGILVLIWCVATEIILYILNRPYPPIMTSLLHLLATQGNVLDSGRLAGLTREPSWLAHQLNVLYLPLWFAATYQRTSVFPRLWKISLENVLLAIGCAVFFLTSPRVSLAGFMLVLVYLFFLINRAIYRRIIAYLTHRYDPLSLHSTFYKIGIGVLLVIVFVGVYGSFSLGVLKVASDHDYRMAFILQSSFTPEQIQQLSKFDENSLFLVSRSFAFLERTVYWMTGWHIFNSQPFLGVGLGNAGLYFPTQMPDIGWASPEVRGIMYLGSALPNIKSLWYRLLAETGVAGFSLFVIWLLITWISTTLTLRSRDDTLRTIALAGQLALLAFVFEGLSINSFGLPYLWMITGLAASAGFIYRQQITGPIQKQ